MLERVNPAKIPSRANYSSWSSGNKAAIGHRICVQDLEYKKVDYSARHLTAVPQDLYPDVHSLDLKLNNFTILRNVSFQFYIQLEDIILGSANVNYIESDTFRTLKNLKSLEYWEIINWPRENATPTITNFKEIRESIKLVKAFLFQQNYTKIID